MSGELVTFQRFSDKKRAEDFVAFLQKHGINNMFEDNSPSVDSNFGTQAFDSNYAVKIEQADFEKVNRLLIEESVADLDSIDRDYYLFSFTDDELREILAHRDEWNTFDFLLAQRLLKDRGAEVSTEELDVLKQQRIAALSKPEPKQSLSITLGYIFAILGGWGGLLIGWFLSSHKRTLPNGDRVYNYRESDRRHGKRILYLSIFFVVFWKLCWFLEWHKTFTS